MCLYWQTCRKLWVNIAVPAKYLNVVRVNQPVTVRADKLGFESQR